MFVRKYHYSHFTSPIITSIYTHHHLRKRKRSFTQTNKQTNKQNDTFVRKYHSLANERPPPARYPPASEFAPAFALESRRSRWLLARVSTPFYIQLAFLSHFCTFRRRCFVAGSWISFKKGRGGGWAGLREGLSDVENDVSMETSSYCRTSGTRVGEGIVCGTSSWQRSER